MIEQHLRTMSDDPGVRKVILRGPRILTTGEVITVRGIFVRRGIDLPKFGESVVVEQIIEIDRKDSETRRYPAVVFSVDRFVRTYDIRVRP